MPSSANQVLALAEQLRETFAAQTVDRNAVNLLVHDALMKALNIQPATMGAANRDSGDHGIDKAA